jgi:5-methylcytosine-specific restriction endonuclease McrA
MSLPKPCLDCGTPTTNGSRCPKDQAIWERARESQRPSAQARGYDAEYRKNRPAVIAQGRNGRPCYICGKPFREGQKITAEHIRPIRKGGTSALTNLAPAHSACNTAWNRKS